MNFNQVVFCDAWQKQKKFFQETFNFHDAMIKAIKVDGYTLMPWFLGFDDMELINFKKNDDDTLFIVFSKVGERVGALRIIFDYANNALISELTIQQAGALDLNSITFKQGLGKWTSNTTGLGISSFYFNGEMQVDIGGGGDYVPSDLILTAGPSISTIESYYSYDAASYGWNGNWSKYLTKFEKKFAEYVGVKYAMATSSCTGALQIALMALDIGPGDEVIVPDQTWVATANAVRYVGAIPVFADIELDTWNINVKSVEKLITSKTKAIMPVHMYGHPARMTALIELAKKHGLKVVEDAAPAIGAEWEGKRCGSFGDFAGFSFQGAKLMVTGEGGMLVTNSDELYQKALKIWDQGRNPSRTFWIDENGVKFKMSNIQAALGLAQLERVDELIEMKRRLFTWYQEGLAGTPFIFLNEEVKGAHSIYWMSSFRLDESAPISRDNLIKRLKEVNVDTRPVFPAISQYPIWPRHQEPQPTAMRVGLQAINLPSGVCLTKDEVMYAAAQVKRIVGG
jgi:perosamine synthetase